MKLQMIGLAALLAGTLCSSEPEPEEIKKLMKDGMKQAMIHGNIGAAEQCYHKAGMVGRDACKNYITDGTHLAPNAPETIARKGSDLPLVDTASMLNSITYAVRRKK